MKRWSILSEDRRGKMEDRIIKILLANRGVKTEKEIKEFLNPSSPYDLAPKDVDISSKELAKALSRIKKAIKSKEKVVVYGDYDTDGVCATAIVWEALNKRGVEIMPFIPKREEGYGMKVERIDEFKKDGVSLVVTVDQGIVANAQVEHASKIGIDVIITDHHLKGKKKPKAEAIIHTTQLAGAGVAWFLANFLAKKFNQKKLVPKLDLVTIGTITDVMPLLGVNRAIVKHGFLDVRQTKRPGLVSLYQSAGIAPEKIGAYEIGFIIGPRLNVSGRMDDPIDSLRLVCTPKPERAADLAQILEQRNRERQVLTDRLTNQARELWLKEDGKSNLIFVSHETFQQGVVGLVAGKLTEEFYRPAIVVAWGKEFSRASARSINEFNIAEAIRSCADILGSHGGHPLAAGFTVETKNLEKLRKRLVKIAEERLDSTKLTPVLKIDLELELEQLTLQLYQELKKLRPFGFGNPEPVFLTRNLIVKEASLVGGDSQHLKLLVTSHQSLITIPAIGFGLGERFSELSPEKKIDLAYNLIINEWDGNKELQLKIRDLRIGDEKRD